MNQLPPIELPKLRPGDAAKLIRFAEDAGIELAPWQMKLIADLEEVPSPPAVVPVSRELLELAQSDPELAALRDHMDDSLAKVLATPSPSDWWAECFPQWRGSR